LNTESGRAIPRRSTAQVQPRGELSTVEMTASKGACSGSEYAFDTLLHDSVIEVFNGTLGKIAGQALVDALKRHTSMEIKNLLEKPDLLDQALVAHLGLVTGVLERKILKRLAEKSAVGVLPQETNRFIFASEVEKIRDQFLKRKQAADQPQPLE